MPFLIMGFFGIDKYIEKKKSGLLILSNALMIYTSYYFSVSGLIVLFIYAFYRYYSKHITIKEIIKNMLKLSLRFIISVLIASILLLPTIYTLLNGRTDSVSTINILELLKPHMYLLYDKYSMGLTLISLISLIYAILKSKKEDKFLSIILLLISIFPIFNFILNGTLYINAKSLIPFIPLVLYLTCKFLDKIFNIKIIKTLLPIYIIISSTCITFIVSSKDKLMDTNNLTNNTEYKNIINNITSKDN